MSKTFNCPTCGAPLDYDGSGNLTMRCPYCGNSVIVPEELREPTPSSVSFEFSSLGVEPALAQNIERLVKAGHKIEAIKLYRQVTGKGLQEAKDAIDALEQGKPLVLPTFAASGSGDFAGLGVQIDRAMALAQIASLAQTNKIEAIQRFRELYNVDLAEAKQAVETMIAGGTVVLPDGSSLAASSAQVIAQTPAAVSVSPQPVVVQQERKSRAGCVGGLVLAAVALAILIGLFAVFSVFSPSIIRSGRNTLSGPGDREPTMFAAPTEVPMSIPVPTTAGYTIALSFGEEGIGPGKMTDARSIAVDNQGHVYVGEYSGGRIQVFDEQGKFLTQWSFGDKKSLLRGLSADRQGVLYVVTGGDIRRYEGLTGELLSTIQHPDSIDDVFVLADGRILATGRGDNLLIFSKEGELLKSIPNLISSITEDSELGMRLAADGNSNIFALGTFNEAVLKFSPSGKYQTQFGGEGDRPGEFRAPSAITVDGWGQVYVSDSKGIQVFSSNGRYLGLIELNIGGFPSGMAVDDQNRLWVAARRMVIQLAIRKLD